MDANDETKMIDKEEKRRLADLKMQEMKKRNEELRKRYEEVEADKKNANISSKMAGLKIIESESAHQGDVKTTPSNRIERQKSAEPPTPPADPASSKHPPHSLGLGKSRGRKTSGGGGGVGQDSAQPPSQSASSVQQNLGHAPQQHRTLTDGPPPDPKFSFLDDPDRKTDPVGHQNSANDRFGGQNNTFNRQNSRNGPAGGRGQNMQRQKSLNDGKLGNVPQNNNNNNYRRQQQDNNNRGKIDGGQMATGGGLNFAGGLSKKDMELNMTGAERLRYQAWLKEREQVDAERMARQQTSDGQWRREWDVDKNVDELNDSNRNFDKNQRPTFFGGDKRSSYKGHDNFNNEGNNFGNNQQRPRRYSDTSGNREAASASSRDTPFCNPNYGGDTGKGGFGTGFGGGGGAGRSHFGNVTFTNSAFDRGRQQQQRERPRDNSGPDHVTKTNFSQNSPGFGDSTTIEKGFASDFCFGGKKWNQQSPQKTHYRRQNKEESDKKNRESPPKISTSRGFIEREFMKSSTTTTPGGARASSKSPNLIEEDQWEDVSDEESHDRSATPHAPGGLQKSRAGRRGSSEGGAKAPPAHVQSDSDDEVHQFEDAVEDTTPLTYPSLSPLMGRRLTPVSNRPASRDSTDEADLYAEISPRKDSIDQIERDMIAALNENIEAAEAALDKHEDDFDAILYNNKSSLTFTAASISVTDDHSDDPTLGDDGSPTAVAIESRDQPKSAVVDSTVTNFLDNDVKLCLDGLLANMSN